MALSIPTMDEVAATRVGKPIPKGPTRLAERTADQRDEKAAEKAWRKDVIKRDGKICRCCKRKVVQQLALAPERLEVHHVTRRDDQSVRWDVRNGMVLCSACHEKITHYKILVIRKRLFCIGDKSYVNAAKQLEFRSVA